jgi:hypothetical protein
MEYAFRYTVSAKEDSSTIAFATSKFSQRAKHVYSLGKWSQQSDICTHNMYPIEI